MSTLFEPITLGDLALPNRIVMAPLTRNRAGEGRVPTPLMAEYYAQRADAGLIIAEATSVSAQGVGYPRTPGIWSPAQVEGWRSVTDAVHARGGRILLQLWHVGRISDPGYHDGAAPVSASALAAGGHVSLLRPKRPHPVPRALETDEIPGIVEDFRRGAGNAQAAGFDGVELHAANGYLIDQFLQDRSNRRDDRYGGSIENRARLLLEVTDALIAVWGAGRVGVHLAPRGDFHSMGDSDPAATFLHAARELGRRRIAFLFLREYAGDDSLLPRMKAAFGGALVANEGFSQGQAVEWLATGKADAVAFGVPFIANPDLPARFAQGAALNAANPASYYSEGATGYTDYPAMSQPSSTTPSL